MSQPTRAAILKPLVNDSASLPVVDWEMLTGESMAAPEAMQAAQPESAEPVFMSTAAATVLSAGAIAFTAFQSDNAGGDLAGDAFQFVLLTNVGAGTTIYFTDGGYRTDTGTYRTNETLLRWVAQSDLGAGTLVTFVAPGGTAVNSTAEWTGINTTTGATTATGSLVLATGGDNITALINPTFGGTDNLNGTAIAQITFGGATFATTFNASSGNASTGLAPGLTDGVNAISLAAIDDGHYDPSAPGSIESGTAAQVRTSVNTDTYWVTSNTPFATGALPANTFSIATAPSISINDVSIAEGNSGTSVLTFTVTRTDNSTAFTVAYATADGTATAGADYVATNGTLTFAQGGALTQTVSVTIIGDTVFEPNETLFVNLSNLVNTSGTTTISDNQGLGTILDEDAAPSPGSLSIDSVTHVEGNSGRTDYVFTVTRTGGTAGAVSATYGVANGTTDGTDFFGGMLPGGGTVSFADGETSKQITVSVAGDLVVEGNETFTVDLTAPTGGATLGTATGTGTITNDDSHGSLAVAAASGMEGNDGLTDNLVTFTVTRSGGSIGAVSATYTVTNGTTDATDFGGTLPTGTVDFADGQTSKTISIAVTGDTTLEPNETFTLTLSAPTGGVAIGTAAATGTIVNDDFGPLANVFINEIHYDNSGTDANEGIEIAGVAGTDLTGYTIVLYNGTNTPNAAPTYTPVVTLSGVIDDEGNGFGALAFSIVGLQNGDHDGLALIAPDGRVVQFLSYEGVITAAAGTAAAGVTSTDIGVSEDGTGAVNASLQLTGAGSNYNDFTWQPDATSSFGSLNAGQTILPPTGPAYFRVNDVSVQEGNSGTTDMVFTVARAGGSAHASTIDYQIVLPGGSGGADASDVAANQVLSGTLTFAAGVTSQQVVVHVNGDAVGELNETLQLLLSNVSGGDVINNASGTGTIVNDDIAVRAIYDIQGRGIVSAFVGQTVQTHGVVTAVDTNGFFLQDANGDGDIGTSDGIFVFTSTAPTVVVGNEIDITGTVQEFVGSTAGSASTTELTSPTGIVVTNQSVALPAAVLISTDGTGRAPPTQVIDDDGNTSYDPTTDGFDFYESLEGMRVTIQTPRVVANTDSFGETYVVASNGAGVTGLNDRSGMTISAGDNNPETLVITRDAGVNASYVANHVQGDVLGSVTGVLQYQFAQYQLIVTDPTVTTTTHATFARETTALLGDATHLSYASFNVENLASVPDSTVTNRNTQAKVDAAFAAHASEVVTALKSPDIIGLQEVQDADGIGNGADLTGVATANKLIAAIVAAGGPTYVYVEVAPTANNVSGGEPGGNIRPGFLYNPARVSYVDGSATALNDAAYNGTRKPLIADFMFNGQKFTAVDMHSTSRGGSDPLYGADQPPTQAGDGARTAQAAAVASYIAAHPGQNFIVNGDFNGYYYEDALKTLESPSNVPGGTGVLNNLLELLPVQERYTYYFGGYYQAFDNILVSDALNSDSRFDVVHYNAGFTDGLSATDHDQVVATIGIARDVATAVAVADTFTATETAVYRGTVLANDTGGGAGIAVTAVNGTGTVGGTVRLASGATVVVNANGTFAYNTDGAFSALNTGQTGSDSFTYTLAGGSTATVTVTVQGVTNSTPSAGNDMIAGTTGADYYDLSAGGDDTVSGGAGNDSFFFGAMFTAADHVDGGSGTNDQIGLQGDYTGGNALVLGANTITGVEVIAALSGFSYNITSIDANLAAGQNLTIYGSGLGSGDNLTFNGSAETDGYFTVYGGMGADNITTGAGNDGIYFGAGRFSVATDHVDGGAGTNDQMALDGVYTNLTIARANVVNVEVLVLLDGQAATPANYAITLADDWTTAGEAHTVYAVGVRNGVSVDGHLETDSALKFYGGRGADTLVGGADTTGGTNWFDGGLGGDTMTGGAGVDTYFYNTAANSMGVNHDTIVNFDVSVDKIDLPFTVTDIDAAQMGTLSTNSFDDDLTAALSTLGANHAVQFTVNDGGALNGHVFEVIDVNGVAGYQAGQDMVIELVNPIGGPITTPAPFI